MASYQETLDRILRGDFADASDEEKRETCAQVKKVCSVAAAAVAFQPFPLVDLAFISPIQIAMVQGIARVHGHRLDKRAVLEILGTFGASILAQNAIMAAAKLVPFAGWLIAMSMAYALTFAIGEVSEHYFRSDRGADPEELKAMFKRVYRDKKAEKEAQHRSDDRLKDKLEQLKEARQADLLTEEEFERKKEELLAGF